MFTTDNSLVEKAKSLIAKTEVHEAQGSVKNEGSIKDEVIDVDVRPQKKLKLSDDDGNSLWAQFGGISLTASDKKYV